MQSPQGAQVFERERIVRPAQERSCFIAQALCGGFFPCGGQGEPLVQIAAQTGAHPRGFQIFCHLAQQVCFATFRTEAQQVHTAHRVQQRDARASEILCARAAPRYGQLEHEIHAAAHRHLRPRMLFEDRRFAPLHEISAHHGYNVRGARRAGLCDVIGVSAVEGVILRDDSRNFHADQLLVRDRPDGDLQAVPPLFHNIFSFSRKSSRKKPESP